MYFCQDVDLLAWEPGAFLDAAFAHQAILKDAAGTLTGAALSFGSATLDAVNAGMVAQAALADDSLTQLLEVVSITDAANAVVSALRGRSTEPPIAALVGGSVKVTVVSFRPQIAAVGDELLALVGVPADRDDADPSCADLTGFRLATIYGTLAAIYRTLAQASSATNITYSKLGFYEGLYRGARRAIAATVDRDGDGVPETRVHAGVATLRRA